MTKNGKRCVNKRGFTKTVTNPNFTGRGEGVTFDQGL
jgi:hypothetical protein